MLTRLFSTPQSVSFRGIQSAYVDTWWGVVLDFIKSGMAEGESLDHIYNRLKKKECQLWAAQDDEEFIAACVTEIVTIGSRKVFNIISVGGSRMPEWLHNMATLEAFARSHNCTAMRFPEIRPGWQRVLKDYTVTKITLEKAL